MGSGLPACKSLKLERRGARLHVTLDNPATRNSLGEEMIAELAAVAAHLEENGEVRTMVLRGAGGTFCSGGDINGFRRMIETPPPGPGEQDPIASRNRDFGDLLIALDGLPQTLVAVVEGAAFGGGLGLACVADITVASRDARFALAETGVGVPPAQIAPFVVRRVGLSQARRLALSGARFDGAEALAIGLVHFACDGPEALEATLARLLKDIGRCGPKANAATKAILRMTPERPLGELLDRAADAFARCLRGAEGREGVAAFLEKRPASWVEPAD